MRARRAARGSTWDLDYPWAYIDAGDWIAWDGSYVVKVGGRPWVVVAA